MSTTLVMTVGTGCTREDIAKALLFSIKRHAPNAVVFLCSKKTQAETIPHVHKDLSDLGGSVTEHVCTDENHVEQLYQEYLEVLRKLDGEVVVDFTSGTKAMSAALFAAGVAVQARQVSYVVGQRDETGRVVQSEDVISFHPAEVFAERQLDRGRELFNRGDFHGAVVLAEPLERTLPKDSPNRLLAKSLVLIGRAYEQWDHYQWGSAAHQLGKAAQPLEPLLDSVDKERLDANARFVRACHEEEYGAARLVDMYLNARRRFQAGRYDDALARLYRLVEYILQWRLKTQFGLKTGGLTVKDLAPLNLSEATRQRYQRRADDNGGTFKIALRDDLELLAEHGDELGQYLINQYWERGVWRPNRDMTGLHEKRGPLQNWLNHRNGSCLAHGTTPAEEGPVKGLRNLCGEVLKRFVPDFEALCRQAEFISL